MEQNKFYCEKRSYCEIKEKKEIILNEESQFVIIENYK
jgi:hypothetical protein